MSPTPAAPSNPQTEIPSLDNGSTNNNSRPAAVSTSSLDILPRTAESSKGVDLDLLPSLFPFPTPTQVSPVLTSLSSNNKSNLPTHSLSSSSELTSNIANASPPMRTPFMTSTMLGSAAPAGGAVPEFLYQLTKMLTDNNRDVIEWSNAMIKVHNPLKLESQILHRYFRHSKFSSFQRQLNYFGFRKLAGKGKMAPCSYVNEAAGQDIGSLLLIKRKSGASTVAGKDKVPAPKPASVVKRDTQVTAVVSKVLTGGSSLFPNRAHPSQQRPMLSTGKSVSSSANTSSHVAIARSAVGRGIRHGLSAASTVRSVPLTAEAVVDPMRDVRDSSLSQLQTNFQHSLNSAVRNHNASANANRTHQLSAAKPLSQLSAAKPLSQPPTAKPLSQPPTAKPPSQLPTARPSQPPIARPNPTIVSETIAMRTENNTHADHPGQEITANETATSDPFVGFLSRNSSLVDLAMIPTLEDDHEDDKQNGMSNRNNPSTGPASPTDLIKAPFEWGFVDFPHPEVDPSRRKPETDNPS